MSDFAPTAARFGLSDRTEDHTRHEQDAYASLLAHDAVTLSAPTTLRPSHNDGHLMCEYHLLDASTGEDVDGGSASTLWAYLADGTYGPGPFLLSPVLRQTTQ